MTKPQSNDDVERAEVAGPKPPENLPGESVYIDGAAGIAELEAHVPIWLWMVVVSLAILGIYYLCTYWNPPGSSP